MENIMENIIVEVPDVLIMRKDKVLQLANEIIKKDKKFIVSEKVFNRLCCFGQLEAIKTLTNQEYHFDTKKSWAIAYAVDFKEIEIVKYLLELKEFDPSVGDDIALEWAYKGGVTELVDLLLRDSRVDKTTIDEWKNRCYKCYVPWKAYRCDCDSPYLFRDRHTKDF